jgi:hypothetical protein
MIRKLAFYGAALIGVYLVVYNGTNSGKVFTAGANGLATDVKAFQGR